MILIFCCAHGVLRIQIGTVSFDQGGQEQTSPNWRASNTNWYGQEQTSPNQCRERFEGRVAVCSESSMCGALDAPCAELELEENLDSKVSGKERVPALVRRDESIDEWSNGSGSGDGVAVAAACAADALSDINTVDPAGDCIADAAEENGGGDARLEAASALGPGLAKSHFRRMTSEILGHPDRFTSGFFSEAHPTFRA